jgi:hypothetical protein
MMEKSHRRDILEEDQRCNLCWHPLDRYCIACFTWYYQMGIRTNRE